MATITESRMSGDGDVYGTTQFSATRTFYVQLDASVENIDDPITPMKIEIPPRSLHPNRNFNGLEVIAYRKIRVPNRMDRWEVEVVYEANPPSELWDVEVGLSLQSEDTLVDLNQKLIGGRAYRAARIPPEEGTHVAMGPSGEVELFLIADAVAPRPTSVLRPRGDLSLSRVMPNFKTRTLQDVRQFLGTTNLTQFYGFQPDELLFMGPEVRSTEGEHPDQDQENVVFDVRLSFMFKPDGWRTLVLYDTFEFEGFESPVEVKVPPGDPGPPDPEDLRMKSEFELYAQSEFREVIRIFDDGGAFKIPADDYLQSIGGG